MAEQQQPPAPSPFVPFNSGGFPPAQPEYPRHEEEDDDDEDDPEERRPWEEDDFGDSEVLDLTGGAGGFKHPPFTVCFPGSQGPDAPPGLEPEPKKPLKQEEEKKPSWRDEVSEPSSDEEVPPDRRPTAPLITPLAPLAPAPVREERPAPKRGPSGSAVVDLLYWRDIKKTGVVFGASLFLLLSLTVFSIVSVSAYVALALLSVTISYRIYRGVFQAIQKSDEGHPFKFYLDSDVALSQELVQKYSNVALGHLNGTIKELRRLFLVEDLIDSLKFAVLMWVLTYVGALFNGLTLLILALISLFSVPIIYERHQTQIDHYLGLVNKNVKNVIAKIQAKIPGLKPKAE